MACFFFFLRILAVACGTGLTGATHADPELLSLSPPVHARPDGGDLGFCELPRAGTEQQLAAAQPADFDFPCTLLKLRLKSQYAPQTMYGGTVYVGMKLWMAIRGYNTTQLLQDYAWCLVRSPNYRRADPPFREVSSRWLVRRLELWKLMAGDSAEAALVLEEPLANGSVGNQTVVGERVTTLTWLEGQNAARPEAQNATSVSHENISSISSNLRRVANNVTRNASIAVMAILDRISGWPVDEFEDQATQLKNNITDAWNDLYKESWTKFCIPASQWKVLIPLCFLGTLAFEIFCCQRYSKLPAASAQRLVRVLTDAFCTGWCDCWHCCCLSCFWCSCWCLPGFRRRFNGENRDLTPMAWVHVNLYGSHLRNSWLMILTLVLVLMGLYDLWVYMTLETHIKLLGFNLIRDPLHITVNAANESVSGNDDGCKSYFRGTGRCPKHVLTYWWGGITMIFVFLYSLLVIILMSLFAIGNNIHHPRGFLCFSLLESIAAIWFFVYQLYHDHEFYHPEPKGKPMLSLQQSWDFLLRIGISSVVFWLAFFTLLSDDNEHGAEQKRYKDYVRKRIRGRKCTCATCTAVHYVLVDPMLDDDPQRASGPAGPPPGQPWDGDMNGYRIGDGARPDALEEVQLLVTLAATNDPQVTNPCALERGVPQRLGSDPCFCASWDSPHDSMFPRNSYATCQQLSSVSASVEDARQPLTRSQVREEDEDEEEEKKRMRDGLPVPFKYPPLLKLACVCTIVITIGIVMRKLCELNTMAVAFHSLDKECTKLPKKYDPLVATCMMRPTELFRLALAALPHEVLETFASPLLNVLEAKRTETREVLSSCQGVPEHAHIIAVWIFRIAVASAIFSLYTVGNLQRHAFRSFEGEYVQRVKGQKPKQLALGHGHVHASLFPGVLFSMGLLAPYAWTLFWLFVATLAVVLFKTSIGQYLVMTFLSLVISLILQAVLEYVIFNKCLLTPTGKARWPVFFSAVLAGAMMLNFVTGVLVSVSRLVKITLGTMLHLAFRVDTSVAQMRCFSDTAHSAFMALVQVANETHNPSFNVAVRIFRPSIDEAWLRPGLDSCYSEERRKKLRIRNKMWLAVTLHRNQLGPTNKLNTRFDLLQERWFKID